MPQAVWLFAPDPAASPRAHPDLIDACHEHGLKVFVQVGTVAAAREAARDGADVIVAQGGDAGGHQFARAAGVVSLVPEVRLMLREEFAGRDVALVAAGGIANEDAVVAAVALGEFLSSSSLFPIMLLDDRMTSSRYADGQTLAGADGVVMGTKFIPAKEADTTEFKRKAVLEARDGGRSTVK